MKKLLLLLCIFTMITGCEKKANYQMIHAEKAKKLLQEQAILIDVRTKQEYEEGHIEGAISLPSETISLTIEKEIPNKETAIIVYCQSGNRSKKVAQILVDQGYQNVYDLGAMKNWSE